MRSSEGMRKWLDYWVIYATQSTLENLLGMGRVVGVIPIWWVVKVGGAAWVLSSGSRQLNIVKTERRRNRSSRMIGGGAEGRQLDKVIEEDDEEGRNRRKPRGIVSKNLYMTMS